MDTWKFFDITHKEHIICNPSSLEKFARLVQLVQLAPGANVLELACGKAELLAQITSAYEVTAVGVDTSPYCIRDAHAKLAVRVPHANVTLLEMDGGQYQPDTPEQFDLTVCLGASWIFNGHKGTLSALQAMTRPGGQIAVGEPYWLQEPDPVYLQQTGLTRDIFDTHFQNAITGQDLGLKLLYTLVSNHDDWDTYESLQWVASENYALTHPDDPDIPELLERVREQKQAYLQYGRDTLGWAIYLFRKTTN